MNSPSFLGPALIAHRGAADRAPENTLASFVEAASAGAHFVEFDVRLSADGELVLLHDPELGRTTEGSALVSELTRAELTALDAGAWFSDAFIGERVPALDELLPLLEELDLGANLELKAETPEAAAATARAVVALMRAHAADSSAPEWPEALLLSSAQPAALEVFAHELPDVPRALVLERPAIENVAQALALGCRYVHVNHRALRSEFIAAARTAGLRLGAYTVNDPDRAEQLWDMGISTVFSDVPDLPAWPRDSDPEDPQSSEPRADWRQQPPAA